MKEGAKIESAWRLRFDIASTLALAWLVTLTGRGVLKPEVHYYLADRYGLLARELRRHGRLERARACEKKAEQHFRLSGADEPPPAVAVAMPVPRAPIVVDAPAPHFREGPDDGA